MEKVEKKRLNKADIALYTREVAKMLTDGLSTHQISNVMKDKYGLQQFQIARLLDGAYKAFAKDTEKYIKHLKDIQMERLSDLYQKAIDKGDIKTANSALETINKMNGLNEAQKIEISGNNIRFKFDTGKVFDDVDDNNEDEEEDED